MEQYDAIIIGTGQAGPSLAGRLAGAGRRVAIVERKSFGGTCVNTGCTPTKTQIASAYAAHVARRAAEYGVTIDGAIHVDMKRVKARKDAVVAASNTGLEQWLKTTEGITVYEGHARFEAGHTVRVGDVLLEAEHIFINVGGRAYIPPLPGVNDVPYLTNSSMMEVDFLPEHLIVVGGSYVGLEFAQMYRRFGAQVTVVEKSRRLIMHEDEDISEAVTEILVGEGITVRTGAECISLRPHAQGIEVSVNCEEGEPTSVGSHVLLAMGRRPNTDDLGLQAAGIETDARGYIKVDEGLVTSVPGVWALGDCNGRGAFTHTAYNDFEIVAANLLDGQHRLVTDRVPAYALYVDPPLGRVGLTEREARATGRPLLIGSRPMSRVSRAVEKGETQGLMKVVVDAETRRILGAAILGPGGDEAIHGILDIMNADVPYETLQHAVPIHPTVSELIPTMLGEMRPAQ